MGNVNGGGGVIRHKVSNNEQLSSSQTHVASADLLYSQDVILG